MATGNLWRVIALNLIFVGAFCGIAAGAETDADEAKKFKRLVGGMRSSNTRSRQKAQNGLLEIAKDETAPASRRVRAALAITDRLQWVNKEQAKPVCLIAERLLSTIAEPAERIEQTAKLAQTFAVIGDDEKAKGLMGQVERNLDKLGSAEKKANALLVLANGCRYTNDRKKGGSYCDKVRDLVSEMESADTKLQTLRQVIGQYVRLYNTSGILSASAQMEEVAGELPEPVGRNHQALRRE
ncbi:MAG: hypothetical protein ACOC8E_07235, partial [Planctomycetota bacterium]